MILQGGRAAGNWVSRAAEGSLALHDKIVGVGNNCLLFIVLRVASGRSPAPWSAAVHYDQLFYESRLVQSDWGQSQYDLGSLKHFPNAGTTQGRSRLGLDECKP